MNNLVIAFFLVLIISSVKAEISYKRPIATAYALNKSLEPEEIKSLSGIVFKGSFEDYRVVEKNGMLVRDLKFRVKEVIKGVKPNTKTLFLSEWAKFKSPFTETLIAKDQDYVFFFYEPSNIGLTSLIGMEQGLVNIKEDDSLVFSNKLKSKKIKRRKFLVFSEEKEPESYQDLKDYLAD